MLNNPSAANNHKEKPMMIFVEAVRQHAIENYNQGGWDILVECWTNQDIQDRIEGAATAAEAIKLVGKVIGVLADHRAEIEATAW